MPTIQENKNMLIKSILDLLALPHDENNITQLNKLTLPFLERLHMKVGAIGCKKLGDYQ